MYPPDIEPIAERPEPPQDPIPEIVYEEDFDRAAPNLIRNKKHQRRSEPKSSVKIQQNLASELLKQEQQQEQQQQQKDESKTIQ